MRLSRIIPIVSFMVITLNASIIDRTVISLGGGQTAIGNQTYGSGGMGVSFASRVSGNIYVGVAIDGVVFNGSKQSTTADSALDVLVNVDPMLGYRLGENLYLYGKAGYTIGTAGGGKNSVSGMNWGGMVQYDLTPTLLIGASITTGQATVDTSTGNAKEKLTQTIGYIGVKF